MKNNDRKKGKTGRLMAIAMALLLSAMFVGCKAVPKVNAVSEEKQETEFADSDELTTSEPNKAETEEKIKIEFTDAAGRRIVLDKPAEKIVSGYYITTSLLIALDLEDQVIGIEAKADSRPVYKLAAPAFLELPNVGTAKDFDIEGCAALKPELVILPKKLTEQAEILSGLGITAMVVNPESMAELEETITNVGMATGKEEQAEKLLLYYEERIAALEAIVDAGSSSGDKAEGVEIPKIYMAGTSGVLRAAGPAMYQNSLIELAGGSNAAFDLTDKGWTNISYEQFLSYDPDMLVIIPEAQYTKEDVLSDPQLKDMRAIKNKAVYEMPSNFEAWDSPVVSGILGVMWLSSIVNEEQYSFDTFKKDAEEFYQEFYQVQIDQSLITK